MLLPYERQIADDRDAHAIYASIAEDDGRDDAMDVDTGYGVSTLDKTAGHSQAPWSTLPTALRLPRL